MKTDLVNIGGTWVANHDLPKRAEADVYETPSAEVRQAFQMLLQVAPELLKKQNPRILDVGAGGGVWGQVARKWWPYAIIDGIEIRETPKPIGYDHWACCDYLQADISPNYDLIIGNPPYYCDSGCVLRSMELLKEGGHLLFLLKLSFIAGQKRLDSVYKELGLKAFGVYSRRIRWHSLGQPLGNSPVREHALYLWEKDGGDRCKVYLVGTEEIDVVAL
jgi:hypothetical protein